MTAILARTAPASPGWTLGLSGRKTFVETGAPLVGAR